MYVRLFARHARCAGCIAAAQSGAFATNAGCVRPLKRAANIMSQQPMRRVLNVIIKRRRFVFHPPVHHPPLWRTIFRVLISTTHTERAQSSRTAHWLVINSMHPYSLFRLSAEMRRRAAWENKVCIADAANVRYLFSSSACRVCATSVFVSVGYANSDQMTRTQRKRAREFPKTCKLFNPLSCFLCHIGLIFYRRGARKFRHFKWLFERCSCNVGLNVQLLTESPKLLVKECHEH